MMGADPFEVDTIISCGLSYTIISDTIMYYKVLYTMYYNILYYTDNKGAGAG